MLGMLQAFDVFSHKKCQLQSTACTRWYNPFDFIQTRDRLVIDQIEN